MKHITDGLLWKGLFIWLGAFVSDVFSNPLLGPDQMSFDSLSPFTEWEGPTFVLVPEVTSPFGAGSPVAAGAAGAPGTGTAGNGPRTNIIRLPCVGGQRPAGSGCRPEFRFPSANGLYRGDTRLYRGRQGTTIGGPRARQNRGGRVLTSRSEPETPDPEQIRGDE